MSDLRHETYQLAQAFGVERLWRGQSRLVTSTKKEVFFGGALAAGKSYAAALKAIVLAIENPGCTGIIVGTTAQIHKQNLYGAVQEHLNNFATVNGYSLVSKVTLSLPMGIELRNGARMLFVGQEWVEKNRGPNFAWAIVDELLKFHSPESVYMEVLGRVRDPRAKRLQIVTTTNLDPGYTGMVKKMVDRARNADPLVDLIFAPTEENKALPSGYIDSLRGQLSRSQYAALVEGKLIRPVASVWPEFRRDRHVIPWDASKGLPGPGGRPLPLPWCVGLDWGSSPAALVAQIVAVSPDGSFSHPDYAPPGAQVGLVCVDEDVSDYNTDERFLAALEKMRAKWTRTHGDCRYVAYDRALGATGDKYVNKLFPGRTKRWSAWKKEEQEVWPGVEKIREWLDPLSGAPRLYVSSELAKRQGPSQVRGIALSMESVPRKRLRDDYTTEVADTPFTHVTDALRYMVRYLAKDSGEAFLLT